ncbi:hypothetical protein L6452_08614 [Arctium lappa]|uniref:Uncharacterized protein n=1 Tax=Arctium lappa TaxID=4217 RepID=A0ACB9DI40_ARCLA|nr:hypothetical protein L6452_08614 [Arctium lappa]
MRFHFTSVSSLHSQTDFQHKNYEGSYFYSRLLLPLLILLLSLSWYPLTPRLPDFLQKNMSDMGTKRKDLDDKRVNVEEHKNHNERNICVVPTEVDGWLEKVRKLEEKTASISDEVGVEAFLELTCRRNSTISPIDHIILLHKLGRKAFKIIEEINCLIQENDMINWTDCRIPPAKVNSKKASTSTPSSHQNDFPSREQTFMEALEQLQPDHES